MIGRSKIDARKLAPKAQERLRRSAMERINNGESPEEVAAGIGINRRTIYKWISAYHYGGDEGLATGARPGRPGKLDGKQLEKLSKIIRTKNPQQLKFEYALWTIPMIRRLIRDQFNVKLSEVSVGRLLKRLGFTPQRPLYRAWQQDKALVEQWQAEEFPKLVKRAKRDKALIFFADESGIRSDHHAGRTWAPKGQTPVIEATGARFSLNMISAITNQGHCRFMTVDGSVTAKVFRDFLKRLIHGVDQKIYLVVDGHPTHKAKLVKTFVEAHKDRIELVILPPYSPELNPDELVWAHVKQRIGKKAVQTKEELVAEANAALRSLQKLPHIVASFFRTPTCAYAAV